MVCIVITAAAFTACNKDASDFAEILESGSNTVVIRSVKTDTSVSLADVLLSLKESGKLDLEGQNGDMGFYITSVNGYSPDASKNEFWAIYTTLENYDGIAYSDAAWGTFEYGGKRLGSASFGVSGLPMVEGELYIITISTF